MVLGGVYVCLLDTCCVVLLHTVSVCKHVCAAIAKVLGGGGVVHISFWRSSGVLAAPLRSLERRENTSLERR